MAGTKKSGYMKYKDKAGNVYTMLPKTEMAQVDGLSDALAGKAAASHTHTKSQISDFPTSMPASDVAAWAKAASKPTYTANEVGAAPSSHVSDTVKHITAAERTAWNAKASKSDIDSAIQTAIQNTWEASY
mgnify:CR=1 FL=1